MTRKYLIVGVNNYGNDSWAFVKANSRKEAMKISLLRYGWYDVDWVFTPTEFEDADVQWEDEEEYLKGVDISHLDHFEEWMRGKLENITPEEVR